MSRKPVFEGAATAIVTPFCAKGVDYEQLGKNILFQLEQGIDAIVVAGTTGEASTMSNEEHEKVIAFAVSKVANKVPVIAGTGSNDTSHAIHLSRYAQEAGADMVLLVPPYYNKTTQRGLLAHFSMIAGSIDIPIMLYNIPQRTGMNIDSSTMAELSHIPNITAVKECNMDQLADCISHCASDFHVYSGDDTNILTVLAFGGKGVVSVLGNILPGQVHRLVRLFLDGDTRESRNMFYSLYPLMKALFLETNPIPVKKAMQLMGMNEGILRMPLLEMSPENTEKLKNVMVSAGLIQEG